MPLLIVPQRCGACERRWLAITTLPETDTHCWYCGSTDVHQVAPPKRGRPPATDPPDDDASS